MQKPACVARMADFEWIREHLSQLQALVARNDPDSRSPLRESVASCTMASALLEEVIQVLKHVAYVLAYTLATLDRHSLPCHRRRKRQRAACSR